MEKMTTKSPMKKFTIKDFQTLFPDDDACLDYLRHQLYPEIIQCENCGRDARHYRIKTRKVYGCEHCGHQISPTADTIFHKSSTPLTLWFYAIYLMAQTRGGISAKQVERELGVTYKTAWRMCKQIRMMLDDDHNPFGGEVEVDESYFGGRKRGGKRGRGSENKTPVVGVAQRKGSVKAVAVSDVKSRTVLPIVGNVVEKGTTVFTDELQTYNRLHKMGYQHHRVFHSAKVYVMGHVHTNTIEGFWSLCKNGIRGVYHQVSDKYLQHYLNEYAFRYNHRGDVTPMFFSFLSRVKA
jgi:transposase